MPEPFKYSREQKGYQLINEVYFWTSVIKDWKCLLKDDKMKMIIIENFQWLVKHELVYIYGYETIIYFGKKDIIYKCFILRVEG